MAPMRRAREQFELDNGPATDIVEGASSTLRRDTVLHHPDPSPQSESDFPQNKRVRLSDKAIHALEDAAEPFAMAKLDTRGLTIREYYERERDTPEAPHNEIGDAAAVLLMTQELGLTGHVPVENQALECGILHSVTCQNFMCHARLHVVLGPNINFIVGHNGSGKSAILTAITLCLGGKAAATNRGQSLKTFVKEGQDMAVLTVKIKNAGEGNYKHSIFGDTIIVERQFDIRGASAFKIKNEAGRIISTKRAHLDDICDFYALQLDNPVNVLTQDMARQFLNSSSPAEKYRFFIKGVQLEQLDTDYVVLADTLTNIESKIDTIKDDSHHLEETNKKAQAKLQLLTNFSGLHERRRAFQRQTAWVQVETEEHKWEVFQRSMDSTQKTLQERLQTRQLADKVYNTADKGDEDAHEALREIVAERQPLQNAATEAEAEAQEAKNKVDEYMAEQRHIHQELSSAKQEITRLEREVEDEYNKLQAISGGAEAKKVAEIKVVEEALLEARSSRNAHKDAVPRLEQQRHDAARANEQSLAPLQRAQKEKEEAEKRLKSLQQNSRGDKAYHPSITAVRRAIEKETRWRQKPVGPLGQHIRLNRGEWSSVLERTFGNTLNAFAVATQDDQKLMTEIIRRCNYRAQVFIVKEQPIDTQNHEPEMQLDTILRVLDIDNDLVRNCLIINQGIDQTILVAERQKLVDHMFSGTRPPNVKGGICLTGDRSGRGLRFSYGRAGSEKSDPVPAWTGPMRIETNMQDQLRLASDNLSQAKLIEDEAYRSRQAAKEYEQKCQQILNKHAKDSRDHIIRCQKIETKAQDLKDELEALMPQDGRLDGFKNMLEDARGNLESLQEQYDASTPMRHEKQTFAELANSKHLEAEQRLSDIDKRIANIQRKVEKAAERKSATLRKCNEAEDDVKFAQQQLDAAIKDRDKQQALVSEFNEQARTICERVAIDPGATYTTLEKKLDAIDREIKNFEHEIGGSEEEITRKAADAARAWNASRKNQRDLESLLNLMTRSLMERRRRWFLFRQTITARARSHFIYLLSERGFKGSMVPNHKTKRLELMIQPTVSNEQGSKESQERQTKTLSGGEKSFTTICLLLSLWDAMGSPIRCLDEFDVFMDSVNRDISMKMMITAARRSVGRQYILITPQAMGTVAMGSDVKIIRLSDPERGQTTLDFTGASK